MRLLAPEEDGCPATDNNWRASQVDHFERMARLSDAYAAAFEGDVQFATSRNQRNYFLRCARQHRQNADLRRGEATKLRAMSPTGAP